ncbi:MAG: hypothetical protein ACT4OK_11200 [Gemmobacter sp.]
MNAHSAPAAPAKESKADKFLRLAEARVSRALDDIRLISQLNARTYEHTPDQVQTVVSALADGVNSVAKAFLVPFTYRVGKVGLAPTAGLLVNPKASAHVETSRCKTGIAKALEALNQNNTDQARAILLDLL